MNTLRDALRTIAWQSAGDTVDDIEALTTSLAREVALPAYGRGAAERRALLTRPRRPVVFVVADDEDVRQSLAQLMTTMGFEVACCDSAEDLLAVTRPAVPCCLLLNVSWSAANGLELQRKIGAMGVPIVFITDCLDVRVIVQAMKAGAVDVLATPVNPELLLNAVDAAMERSEATLRRDAALQSMRECYEALTPRECEVMGLVVSGLLNKQVAFELGISVITVKAHRGQVMRKMKADSLPHLVRMAARLTPRTRMERRTA